jgi:hypothetical protein
MIAKGRVSDSVTRETLPGATIAAYAQQTLLTGTTSDVNGMFSLEVPAGTTHVQVSFVGYGINIPLFRDGVLQQVDLVFTGQNQPPATVTAKRTYNKYYVALAVAIVALIIYYKA